MYTWQCPQLYLKDLLIQVSHVQQRFTRASNELYVPRANIELYKESFLYNGPRLLKIAC